MVIPTPPTSPPITIINQNTNNNTNNNTVTVVQQQQVVQQQANIQPVLTAVNTSATTTPVVQGPPLPVGTATTPPPALSATDNFQILDEANQAAFHTPGSPYPGPIAGIQNEYININTTNLDITAITPNAFIQSGSGNDTLEAFYGRNVLDAGGGSNVLVGGVGGIDTFIADISGGGSLTDLIKDFHINDDVVIKGISSSTFSISTSTSVGAFGSQLEIDATPNGGGAASTISIAGYSAADVSSGKVSISFSTDSSGNPFMLVHANG